MRSRIVLLGGAAMLASTAALAAAADQSAAQAQPVGFVAPARPVLVSRTLVRLLPDGKTIAATRTYRMQFTRDGSGWRVDGVLVDVKVEAPPLLDQLAAIERNRPDPEMFPFRLDASGRIVPRPAQQDGRARTRAAAVAEMMLANAIQAPAQRGEASAMLMQVSAAAGTGTVWPADLFNPATADSRELRDIALPDGTRGTVEIALAVSGRTPGHLPTRVERVVTTRLSGTERVSREIWTMAITAS